MEEGLNVEMEAPPAKRLKQNDHTATHPTPSSHPTGESGKYMRKKKKGGGWRKRQQQEEQEKRESSSVDPSSSSIDPHTDSTQKGASGGGWKDYVMTNELLMKYYRDQHGIVPHDQWADFEAHLRMDLPSTFRITGAMSSLFTAELNRAASEWPFPLHQRILTILEQQYMPHFAASTHFKLGGLPWFPHGGAWQFAVPPRKLKRENIAASEEADQLKTVIHDFHEFLVAASHVGAVTRQEAVSMIPPLFLDIQPHHWVLDLCAAPGSKTTQLIECLHTDPAAPLPAGVVVANDVNPHRCNTLISQTKRLNSPTLLVTQHEAQLFPNPRGSPEDTSSETSISGKTRTILYDRILCDVPCSGDGTIRKSPEVWGRWTPHGGLGLHIVQTRILSRAYHLLRPGSASRIVYSTCSLNPVEDEAVVAQVLLQAKGALELVDISGPASKLGLKWQAGLPSWRVMDKAGNWFSSYDQIPEENRGAIQVTHFPPESSPFPLNLERCCRFLPHLQDTGGFFVAVLQLRSESSELTPAESDTASTKPKRQHYQKPKAKPEYTGDPPFFLPPQDTFAPVWSQLVDFFGILPSFPAENLMTRSNLLAKLYLVSDGARALFAADSTKLIRFKHMGIRLFERMAGPNLSVGGGEEDADDEPAPASDIAVGPSRCGYRICQEAAHIMSHPTMTNGRRIVRVGRDDLHALFERKDMQFSSFSEPVKDQLEKMEVGSLVFVLEGHEGVCFAGWRGLHACHLRVSQMDKKSYSSLLNLGGAKMSE
jgi:16S rRNA C967 or C1407 C5-methylase (RsmB/RsmF family)